MDMSPGALRQIAAEVNSEPRSMNRAFWSSVTDPRTFRECLVDRRSITGFDVIRQVQFGYTRSPLDLDPDYVAFLRPANNRLVVGLSVWSGSGRALHVLSAERCAGLVAQAIDQRARELPGPGSGTAWAQDLLIELLELIRGEGPNDFKRTVIDERQRQLTDQARQTILDLIPSAGASPAAEDLAGFVGMVAVRNLLVCEVPADDAGVIAYEMRESIAAVGRTPTTAGDRVALALGAVPSALYVPLYKAGKSSGYRLEVDVGGGNYIRSITSLGGTTVQMTGTGTQFATVSVGTSPSSGTGVTIGVAEHPSKTMLSSLLLSFATFSAVLGVWLARDSIEVWRGGSISLGDLGALLGIVAVAAGGIRAVVYRGLEGRTLARSALASAVCSSLTLLFLTTIMLWSNKGTRSTAIGYLLVGAALALVAVGTAFTRAVGGLARLRSESSRDHAETPATR